MRLSLAKLITRFSLQFAFIVPPSSTECAVDFAASTVVLVVPETHEHYRKILRASAADFYELCSAGFLSRTSSLHAHTEVETSTGASREATVGCVCCAGGNRNEIRLSTNKLVLSAQGEKGNVVSVFN
jgi:hypothetical protein